MSIFNDDELNAIFKDGARICPRCQNTLHVESAGARPLFPNQHPGGPELEWVRVECMNSDCGAYGERPVQ